MNESHSPDQDFITKLNEIVLNNLSDEGFSVERLAEEAGLSRTSLYRRLKSIKNQDINKFIREVRLQRAMEMLRNKQGTAAEISFRVGFGSPAYFNKCFHEYFGYPPGKVKHIGSYKEKDKPVILKRWKIASYISFVVIVALIGLVIIPRITRSNLEKSIAVLPFKYLGDNPDEQYLADGVMDQILHNLSAIEELLVLDRTSVEQYHETENTANEICQQLGVSYLLEGSLIKIGDQGMLLVRLIEYRRKGNIWRDRFNLSGQDTWEVQGEVAQKVAKELRAVITPQEKQLIEKIPTTNLTAYDYYLRGKEEHWKYQSDNDKREALESAENFYFKALEYDTTFAQAYVGLANVFWDKHFWDTYFAEDFLDSVLTLANEALSYDDQLAEAYTVKGGYYLVFGKKDRAIEEFDNAIKFNPNDYQAYEGKGNASVDDFVNRIDNFHKAASLNRGPELPGLLARLAMVYLWAGFPEKGEFYIQQKLKIDGDSAAYYSLLTVAELMFGNFEKAINIGLKGYTIDSLHAGISLHLGNSYKYLGQHEASLKYFEKYIERTKYLGIVDRWNMHNFGYAYWQNENKEKAEHYFNEQIKYSNRHHELNETIILYCISSIYAFRGEKEKAYENLRTFYQRKVVHKYFVTAIKYDPKFDSIREEPEFQRIVKHIEAKHQAEHERVKQWLEENNML